MMKSNRFTLYAVISWVLSIGVAYFIGWWRGVKSVANVAAGAASTGLWLVVGVLAIVAVATAIAAFRVRGYIDSKQNPA
jgi:membrane protein DedA with SNARE-associated domain